jgi:hypothetical protein
MGLRQIILRELMPAGYLNAIHLYDTSAERLFGIL